MYKTYQRYTNTICIIHPRVMCNTKYEIGPLQRILLNCTISQILYSVHTYCICRTATKANKSILSYSLWRQQDWIKKRIIKHSSYNTLTSTTRFKKFKHRLVMENPNQILHSPITIATKRNSLFMDTRIAIECERFNVQQSMPATQSPNITAPF